MTAAPSDLLDRLPHRSPFLFISRVHEIVPGSNGQATWDVTGEEAFFAGHFPGRPLLPGVIVAEALAQLSGLVVFGDGAEGEPPPSATLAQLNVRFRVRVRPPAAVLLMSRVARVMGPLFLFDVQATVEGQTTASGSLTLATGDTDGTR